MKSNPFSSGKWGTPVELFLLAVPVAMLAYALFHFLMGR